MKKLKLKLDEIEARILRRAVNVGSVIYSPTSYDAQTEWAEAVAGAVATRLSLRIDRLLIEVKAKYTIPLDHAEAILVEHLMLRHLDTETCEESIYSRSVFRAILNVVNKALT